MEKFSFNAIKLLEHRYLLKDENLKIIETPQQMFERVAKHVAKVEKYSKYYEKKFFNMMNDLEFLPNSPTLMNAGTRVGQLSACFVLPIEDSIPKIFESLKDMAVIHQSGGGTGFNFSRLRPKGTLIKSTMTKTTGPVSFMKIFNDVTDVIKQGGRRRGANMAVLNVNHPDIIEFVDSKLNMNELTNFNISVAVTDDFMNAVKNNEMHKLVNSKTNTVILVKAKKIFDRIVRNAWKTGEPGLIFIDRINENNPLKFLGNIESTNPCGEQPLFEYESCNLGSINVSRFVKNGKVEWKRLATVVAFAVRFLDDVIDANKYPLKKIEKITKMNRKIGLGVMGFADMLVKLNIPYNSEKALRMAEKLMMFVRKHAVQTSIRIGKEKGSFTNFKKSELAKKYKHMRNASLTTIAPTGSISIIAGCSSGIEPLFALSYVRNVLDGEKLVEVNKDLVEVAKKKGFYDDLVKGRLDKLPKDVKSLFVTAFDVDAEWHVKMQAAFQKYTDAAVSKTVNLNKNAKVEDVKRIYTMAWEFGCKGITVYRDKSRKNQVLKLKRKIEASAEYSGGCMTGECSF
ncbi:adenosylcobalamin-dependent ribonucleoside-diphosphate reductase [Candidatus Woesearchaeota archaeon]|nr:MAG: adenosylcobalamin-dependent ribonucleoside-diphosphate reductase [Candidatus Woesearchaeota archaeon]